MLAILGSFPVAEYARMIEWILRLGRNIKVSSYKLNLA